MPDVIDAFDGEYRFLSNFWPSKVTIAGITYPTVEHAFQAMKTLDISKRQFIATARTPNQAKQAGRKVKLRVDWEEIKLEVMRCCLERKFEDPTLRRLLLATGDVMLVEGNTWGDTYWGMCNGKGANNLGILLMSVRSGIRDNPKR